MKENTTYEIATFGAGCFWCVEAIFQRLKGVESVESGYSGGNTKNPTYDEVSAGNSGHAEVCQIKFNPDIISFNDLLEVFWFTHDPTQLNRQGNDYGTQYRSVIFYHNEEQRKAAVNFKNKLISEKVFEKPIVTEITQFSSFYKAEGYHQNYYNKNKNNPYCAFVINPKIEKFIKQYKNKINK